MSESKGIIDMLNHLIMADDDTVSDYWESYLQQTIMHIESLQAQVAALEALLRKAAEGTWWDGNEPFTIQRLESWIVAALAEMNDE